jgi:hypothetical protein
VAFWEHQAVIARAERRASWETMIAEMKPWQNTVTGLCAGRLRRDGRGERGEMGGVLRNHDAQRASADSGRLGYRNPVNSLV